jgi:hypothetical protein
MYRATSYLETKLVGVCHKMNDVLKVFDVRTKQTQKNSVRSAVSS